jgi:ketosteroid isomerase-like protein
MRRVTTGFIAALLAIVPLASAQTKSAQSASASAEEELKKLDHTWLDAEKRYDVAFCQKFFADSYVLVLADGEMYSKEKWLGILASPKERPTLEVLDPEDIQVHINGNVAILTDRTTIKGHDAKGNSMDGEYRVFRVLIKQNGSWKATGVVMNQIH